MKKTLPILILVTFAFAISPWPLLAQTPDTVSTLQSRNEERKKRLQLRLDKNSQTRLQKRCAKAQAKVSKVKTKAEKIKAARDQRYTDFAEKINQLITRLKTGGVDTTKLEEKLKNLASQQVTIDARQQALLVDLGDLEKMDCAKDPTAFKAALLDARFQAIELKKLRALGVKTAKTDIKKDLSEILKSRKE